MSVNLCIPWMGLLWLSVAVHVCECRCRKHCGLLPQKNNALINNDTGSCSVRSGHKKRLTVNKFVIILWPQHSWLLIKPFCGREKNGPNTKFGIWGQNWNLVLHRQTLQTTTTLSHMALLWPNMEVFLASLRPTRQWVSREVFSCYSTDFGVK